MRPGSGIAELLLAPILEPAVGVVLNLRRRALLSFVAGGLLVAIAFTSYNLHTLGHPVAIGYWNLLAKFSLLYFWPRLQYFVLLLFRFWMPLALLLFLAAVDFAIRRERKFLLVTAWLLPFVAFYSFCSHSDHERTASMPDARRIGTSAVVGMIGWSPRPNDRPPRPRSSAAANGVNWCRRGTRQVVVRTGATPLTAMGLGLSGASLGHCSRAEQAWPSGRKANRQDRRDAWPERVSATPRVGLSRPGQAWRGRVLRGDPRA